MSCGRREKHLPRPITAPPSPGAQRRKALVLGGSLTRSPDGRLQTLQTHGIYPSPQTVQEVWSNITRRRYKDAWEGQPLEAVGHKIEWEPHTIACACGHSLGDYVAYRVTYPNNPRLRGERGIVEKTSRHYQGDAGTAQGQAGSRGPKSNPRYWLKGESGYRAARTTACFRCPGCGREHRRKLARLGEQLFELPTGETFLLD